MQRHSKNANLHSASLANSGLARTNLEGADFTFAKIEGADLVGATHNADTDVSKVFSDVHTLGAWW